MNNTIDDIKIHIACATDDGFAYPLAVMIVSVLENHKNQKVCIHLFSALLSENNKSKIEQLVKKYNQSFIFYRLNPLDFKAFPTSDRISSAAYYRLLMPGKIDKKAKRFLYLDADIIVINNLTPLFDLNMGETIFGAIHDVVAIDWKLHKKHNIPEQYLYFNSGVLLINREKWENINATQKLQNILFQIIIFANIMTKTV
ncbi:MAG: glycosyltransferase family 8 protein [Bacteroidales bacterium]|nr:glycosyltransferase family 8 protein [Bacteroidales bacterium]